MATSPYWTNVAKKLAAKQPTDPLGNFGGVIDRFQQESREGAQAYAELALPGFREAIGRALGDAYAVAGRSGRITTDLARLNREAASMVANTAAYQSNQAIGQALQYGQLDLEREKFKAEKRGGFWKAVGGLIGKGLGVASNFFLPGSGAVSKVIGGLLGTEIGGQKVGG